LWSSEQKGLIGIDLGSSSVKLVELRGTPGAYELASIALAVVEGDRRPASYMKALTAVLDAAAAKTTYAAAAVSGPDVAVRSFKFPRLAPSEVEGATAYEASQVIPFDIQGAYVDYMVIENDEEADETTVLFVAAGRAAVDFKTELLEGCGLEPRLVGVDALALLDAAFLQPDMPASVAVVDVGAKTTSIGIGRKGRVPFVRDVDVAGNSYTAAISTALGVSLSEAEEAKITESDHNPTVIYATEEVSRHLIGELSRSLAYYESRAFGSKVEQILVCGGGSGLPGLPAAIEEAVGVPTRQWGVLRDVSIDERRFDRSAVRDLAPMASLAAALAMRGEMS